MAPSPPVTKRAEIAGRTPAAWLIWGLGATFFCYAFFHRVAPSVMIDQLMADLAVGGAMLGNLSALYFYAYASLQVPAGLTIDRWGPRRAVGLAIAVCALGSLISGFGASPAMVYTGRLLVGVGAAFSFIGALQLATHWFPAQRFALLSGLTMLAGMTGGIAGQAPLAVVVDAAGWRSALIGAGMFGLALASLFVVVVRDRPKQAPARGERMTAYEVLAGLGEVVRKPHNWLLGLISGTMSAPMLAFAGLWGVAWLMQVHDFSRPAAAILTSLLLAGWAIGAPLAGWLSDRMRQRKAPLVASASAGFVLLSAVLYLPISSEWFFGPLFLLCGAMLGCMVLIYPLAGETNRVELSGTSYAFCNMFSVGVGGLFQPFIGWLLDLGWDGTIEDGVRVYTPEAYGWAFSVLLIFLAGGIVGTLAIRESGATRAA